MMERGETRLEKFPRWVGDEFDGVEYHVYRMGDVTYYYLGTVREVNGKWRVETEKQTPASAGRFSTRRDAIFALCSADDKNLL